MFLALLVAGCSAPQAGGLFHDPAARFSLTLPGPPWQPASVDGALVSLRQPTWAAGMGLHADCGRPEPGILSAVARHLFFGLQHAEIATREPVELAGAPGLRTHLRARLDDQPVEVDAVTVRLHGCLYDFMLVAPPAHFPEAAGDFERFLHSWRSEGHP